MPWALCREQSSSRRLREIFATVTLEGGLHVCSDQDLVARSVLSCGPAIFLDATSPKSLSANLPNCS
jgi:hypothetical protein